MKTDTRSTGIAGETQAARYLASRGLKIIEQHYQTRWGEVDLICRDRDTWVFVEVKYRSQLYSPTAADAVTRSKQIKIIGAALSYLKKHGLHDVDVRFDVVLIEAGELEWIPGAFESDAAYTY